MPDNGKKYSGRYRDGGYSLCEEISAKSGLSFDELLTLPTDALEELREAPTREKLEDVKQRGVGRTSEPKG